jgi:hypothetical protein
MASKAEFHLPGDALESASGADKRLDAVCADCDQAEDFCDHGAGILAGLVGHLRGDQIFFESFFGTPDLSDWMG